MKPSLGRLLKSFLLVVVLLHAGTARASASLPTNMDMVVATIEEAADRALAAMETPGDPATWESPVLIRAQAEHDANWLVDHILAERLLARGFEVSLDTTLVQQKDIQLSYRVIDLGIRGTTGLLSDKLQRQSHLTLSLRLTQTGDETLYWQTEETVFQSNHAPKAKLDFLQTTPFKFAETNLEEKSWGKFVEPIIVSAVLGGLVSLFFSNR